MTVLFFIRPSFSNIFETGTMKQKIQQKKTNNKIENTTAKVRLKFAASKQKRKSVKIDSLIPKSFAGITASNNCKTLVI